ARSCRDEGRQQRILRQMCAYRRDIGSEIEDPSDARDDSRQRTYGWEADGCGEAFALRQMGDLDHANVPVLQHRPTIDLALDPLDAVENADAQIGQHRRPVIGRAITKADGDADSGDRPFGQCFDELAPQHAGRSLEELAEGLVETANAAEARGDRD